MSPRIRWKGVPTTTAKLGVDTVRLLRALIAGGRVENGYGYDATLDDAIWALVKGVPKGILNGVPLDRSVYLTPPAETGIPLPTSGRRRKA